MLTRIRFFVGGLLSGSVSLFTFYVSAIYNAAIATSNTEIIVNAVVISFITDIDEVSMSIYFSGRHSHNPASKLSSLVLLVSL